MTNIEYLISNTHENEKDKQMRLNKNLIKISLKISGITLITSLILTIYNLDKSSAWLNYLVSIVLAIFGSSVVLFVTSFWGYYSERKKYEIRYATYARDFILKFLRFLAIYNGVGADPEKIYDVASNIHSIYDTFAFENDVEIFGYLNKDRDRAKKMKELHNVMYEYARELSRIEQEAMKAMPTSERYNGEFKIETKFKRNDLENIYEKINTLFKDNIKQKQRQHKEKREES